MPIVCRVCNVTVSGPIPYEAHLAGRPHRLKVQPTSSLTTEPRGHGVAGTQSSRTRSRNNRPNRTASSGQPPSQPQTNHPRNNHFARQGRGFQPAPSPHPAAQASGAPDHTGLDEQPEVAPATRHYLVDFGVIRNAEAGPEIREVDVECTENNDLIHAEELDPSIIPVKQSRARSIRGFQVQRQTYLSPGRFRLSIRFDPQGVLRGVHVVRLCLDFTGGERTYTKTHKLKAIIGSPTDHGQLKPIAPFTRSKRPDPNDWHRRRMLRGKPTILTPDFMKLGFYDIPEQYRRKFEVESNRSWEDALRVYLESLLPSPLDVNTYKDHWTHLLWHEELQMELDLKMYDMKNVPVRHISSLDYSLSVPGLLEKRPSIIVTDVVAMKGSGLLYRGPIYGGYVTDVQQSEVILRMPENLPNQLWDVRFTVNRLLLWRMHEAINKSPTHERILFPNSSHKRPYVGLNQPTMRLDRKVAGNHKQTLAVQQIVAQPPGDIPFILFGPPGTGKTTALVEAIHQVVASDPKNRVLVCAPSNTATDLIALRLSKMHNSSELLRLNAPARRLRDLPSDLRKYSFVEEDKFKAPLKHDIEKFRIVASTCFYASIPQALRVQDHFTHIFVDESGHASEPEIMVAILQNASPNTNVIVCGDPMQLGPIVQSKACAKLGMDTSFLDRLMKLPVYDDKNEGKSDSKIVKLLQNYRSHPAILRFSNVAFYENELESCASTALSKSLEQFAELPKIGFPVIFHSICGENQREAKSPSFFNIDEATLVRYYVRELLSDRRLRLKGQDIGVISPYRQQCTKIAQLLKREGQRLKRPEYECIDVKVTEDWQGQERRVIIVSTVRSDPVREEDSPAEFLGFVANWRRTNVTLTRAQALLIVIGNAPTLELDPAWYFFLHYVHASGGWTGDDVRYPPVLTTNPFVGAGETIKSYKEFDDARWEALMQASRPFEQTE